MWELSNQCLKYVCTYNTLSYDFRESDELKSGELAITTSDKDVLEGRRPFEELSVGEDGKEGREGLDRVGEGKDEISVWDPEDDSLRRNSTHIWEND